MAHAQQNPNEGDQRVMECMIYADTRKDRKSKNSSLTPSSLQNDVENISDDDSIGGGQLKSYELTSRDSSFSVPESPTCKKRVLKKPFFKNWDDFMNFDITYKHKMPITLSEFELLLQKEKETMKGWDVCVDRKEIMVAKTQSGPGIITLRAWATLPGVDLYVALFLIFDITQRVKWDKVFAVMNLVAVDVQGSDIVYSLLKVPTVTPRDFLQYRRVLLQDDGSILIVLRSAEHIDSPEEKGYIRAESYISGYVLRQSFDGPTPVLNIFLMSCSDTKGMIPKWIINYFAPKKPGEWVETLRKAGLEYQEQNPCYKDKLQRIVAGYAADNPFDYEPEETAIPLDVELLEL